MRKGEGTPIRGAYFDVSYVMNLPRGMEKQYGFAMIKKKIVSERKQAIQDVAAADWRSTAIKLVNDELGQITRKSAQAIVF